LLASAGGVVSLKESVVSWPASGLTSSSHGFVVNFRQAEKKHCRNQEGALTLLFLPFACLPYPFDCFFWSPYGQGVAVPFSGW